MGIERAVLLIARSIDHSESTRDFTILHRFDLGLATLGSSTGREYRDQ